MTVSVSGLRLGKVCDSYPICLALHESIFPVPSFTRKGDVAGFFGFIDFEQFFPAGGLLPASVVRLVNRRRVED